MKPAKTGMRIVAGEWRGRKLAAPEGDTTRPTADRTRETLFSMLTSRLGSFEGLKVADLFAGSGALGLEALSRGAAHCLFVDQDAAAIRAIRRNIANLQAQARCDVRACSVLSLGPTKEPLDLVLLDPPYDTGAGSVAIDKLARLGWIGDTTWVSLETSKGESPSIKGFESETMRDIGKARLHILRRTN
ncbi:16S rRNA (guanine(966)-N(2))-methyltransferase RsmD [Novosphingobium mangrovi (ex Huang et al. 2023)]|uniref:16S rRNA (Guanine(966)-N(2))-methyltransferase RsmD n=1 Tax=Novosphingobium mangrovi (ex Huang et al. 2023) TaxID=2976432 RepID=A0ABT2I7W7_9SPHN|nr:16S rRNA (guanine(966)-N(2))-methyltransferase RsmD [Novosphingobium mangrovi (ex Huang et al. 2023)]MCT2400647.1 16S rRNA (guanine(966)-N(2))-methyltransferase RsmD [Novosphingobium mangrovi (ex Huang et al. 2023)]